MPKHKLVIIIFLLLQFNFVFTMPWPRKYWIEFTDKEHNTYTLNNVNKFMSARAIKQRAQQHITFNETDLPVSKYYTDSLTRMGVKVFYTSKWLNGATIQLHDSTKLPLIKQLSFVNKCELTWYSSQLKSVISKDDTYSNLENTNNTDTLHHLVMLQGNILHKRGFTGKGMLIAVIDNGFNNAPKISSLAHLFNNNNVLDTRNFVNLNESVYTNGDHGTAVLSVLAGNLARQVEGSAPQATYILLKTEDNNSEFPVEEDNWIAAAELADSLGANVISVSLGYNDFNDPQFNHTWQMLNTQSIRVSMAATMAVKKGMIVCISAGNEGNKAWHYIGFPADAHDILTVAAVDSNKHITNFSSIGYIRGNIVKPDIAAQGKDVPIQNSEGIVRLGNGTSFASPIISGLAACLWQAYPMATNVQIMNAIRQSGSQANLPDSLLGYGIPNFSKAYYVAPGLTSNLEAFPNPFTNYFFINTIKFLGKNIYINIYNSLGNCVYNNTHFNEPLIKVELNNIAINNGIYIVKATDGFTSVVIKMVKK